MIVDLTQAAMSNVVDFGKYTEYREYSAAASGAGGLDVTVTVDGSPAARTVRLHKRSTGALVEEGTSSSVDGTYTFDVTGFDEYTLVVIDDYYGAVVYDRMRIESNRDSFSIDFSGTQYTPPSATAVDANFDVSDEISLFATVYNDTGPFKTAVDFPLRSDEVRTIDAEILLDGFEFQQFSEKRIPVLTQGVFETAVSFPYSLKPKYVKPPENIYSVSRFWAKLTDGVDTIEIPLRTFTIRSKIDRNSYGEYEMIYDESRYNTLLNMLGGEVMIDKGFQDLTNGTVYRDLFISQTIVDIDFDAMTGKLWVVAESTFSPAYKNIDMEKIVSRNIGRGSIQYRLIGSENDIQPGDFAYDSMLDVGFLVGSTTYYVSDQKDFLEVMENAA